LISSPSRGGLRWGWVSMQGQTNKTVLQIGLQRRLRRNMTDAERKLWNMLRDRQMAGLKFRRQHPFEGYILDFVCLAKKVVIEIDGGQHQERETEDGVRTHAFESAGFRVLRFWNHEILQDSRKQWRKKYGRRLTVMETHPHPIPLLEGEGVSVFTP